MSKLLTLGDAIRRFVPDGALLFIGGFGHCVPFAAGHELIRQGRKRLTLCRTGTDILFDQLIGAGCAAKVIFGYLGNPGVGISHSFRRAVDAGSLGVEEWTNFTLLLRLHAGRIGVPFLPSRALLAGDIPKASADARKITCPFTGESLSAIPALLPEVALIHAQRADEDGNVQLWGIDGDTREGALASRMVIATVEEMVPREVIRAAPEKTIVPAHRTAAVCHVPGGAHPSYVQGYYTRDDEHFVLYDRVSRNPDELSAYLDRYVRKVADREAYLHSLEPGVLERIGLASRVHPTMRKDAHSGDPVEAS
jgi:glutaconate CoA-transferase subunit A